MGAKLKEEELIYNSALSKHTGKQFSLLDMVSIILYCVPCRGGKGSIDNLFILKIAG